MTQAVFMNTNHIFMRNNSFFVIAHKISVKINVENISYLNAMSLSELKNLFYLVVFRIMIKHCRNTVLSIFAYQFDLCLTFIIDLS